MIKPNTRGGYKPDGISIHKASANDAPAIALLAQQLAAHEQNETVCTTKSIRALLKNRQSPQCELIVAQQEETIVAFALYYAGYDLSSDTFGFHLADICVGQAYRRHGIGRAMLGYIAQHALDDHRQWLSLTVLNHNATARNFYESLGLSNVPVCFMAAGRKTLSSICT